VLNEVGAEVELDHEQPLSDWTRISRPTENTNSSRGLLFGPKRQVDNVERFYLFVPEHEDVARDRIEARLVFEVLIVFSVVLPVASELAALRLNRRESLLCGQGETWIPATARGCCGSPPVRCAGRQPTVLEPSKRLMSIPQPQIGASGRDRRAIVHQLRKARLSYRAVALPLTMPFGRQGRFYERSLHTPIRGLGAL
jgi:hypothetical protein